MIRHSDQYRGMEYAHPGGPYSEPSPDYFQYVPGAGAGLIPVGYGYRSIERIVEACAGGSDEGGLIATPANSRHNERVIEAARKSGVDVAADKIAALERGEVPIYEPHLAELIAGARAHLRFTTDYANAIPLAQVVFIAVGTPSSGTAQCRRSATTSPPNSPRSCP